MGLLVSLVCDAWCDVVVESWPHFESYFILAEWQGTKEPHSHVMETSIKDGFRIRGVIGT